MTTHTTFQRTETAQLPLSYRLYSHVHHALTSLQSVSIMGKHPFIVARNRLSRQMYHRVLTMDGLYTVTTRHGFAMRVPLDDQAAASILFEGEYSPSEGEALLRLLSCCSSFLDVGANLGYFTLLALSRLHEEGTVVSLEPNDAMCDLIRQSLALNNYPTCAVMAAAASDRTGRGYLLVDQKLSSNARVLGQAADDGARQVDLIRIDDVIDRHRRAGRWLIKIDVEGAEVTVLRGCSGAMSGRALFMCELFHASADDVRAIVDQHAYVMLDHQGRHVLPEDLRSKSRTDLVLTPSEEAEAISRCLAQT
jgi:FkbM family methyltransferase